MLVPGALFLSVVYQHSPWIHKQFYRGKVVFSARNCLRGGRMPKVAGLLTQWVKEVFIFFSKHKGFPC